MKCINQKKEKKLTKERKGLTGFEAKIHSLSGDQFLKTGDTKMVMDD